MVVAINAVSPGSGISVPGALPRALHRHDRIVEVAEHLPPCPETDQRCPFGQTTQKSGDDRIELADVQERQGSQERAQRRRSVRGICKGKSSGFGTLPHIVVTSRASEFSCGATKPHVNLQLQRKVIGVTVARSDLPRSAAP